MIKMVVVDVDHVIVENRFITFFGNGNWLKIPWLKKAIFYLIEIFEFVLGIRHRTNEKLVRALKVPNIRRFVLTDRSALGIYNVKRAIKAMGLISYFDFIQVRGKNKNITSIRAYPEINFCPAIKPSPICLYKVTEIIKELGIEPFEVLVVDDSEVFNKVVRKFGFKTFPADREFIKDPESFLHLLGRRIMRSC